MKVRKYLIPSIALLFVMVVSACEKENEEFIFAHENNLISQLIASVSHSGAEFRGEIHEFNRDGERMESSFTLEEVKDGYGLILVPISKSLEKDVDITNMYLRATVTYDAIISPSLSGRHDISGEGLIITVTSGERTKRQYRIRGYYE